MLGRRRFSVYFQLLYSFFKKINSPPGELWIESTNHKITVRNCRRSSILCAVRGEEHGRRGVLVREQRGRRANLD
jgi:hypothetical protein